MNSAVELREYVDPSGKNIIREWLRNTRDIRARAKIATRLGRLVAGNFGDCKSLGGGIFEVRIDWGPGYRVYYARVGAACILLLCGGDKRKQPSDIQRAERYLADYKSRVLDL